MRFLNARVKFAKFLMSILNWQANSSSNFASFFIFMTHNSIVNFKFTHFQLCTKGCHESLNFETFKCSGENLPNSSCHFPNHRSLFSQILRHSLVSWNITPLYYFSSKLIYVGQKQPIKVWIFGTFQCSTQNWPNSLCHFWTGKSYPLEILHHSSLSDT